MLVRGDRLGDPAFVTQQRVSWQELADAVTIHSEPYPFIEIGRTVSDDRLVVQRDGLVVALTCVRALSSGFGFRLSVIADHVLDPWSFWFGSFPQPFWFGPPPENGQITLRLTETDTQDATTTKNLQYQGGGGGGSRYEYDFWAPVSNAAVHATIWVGWPTEWVPPTPAQFRLAGLHTAAMKTLSTAGSLSFDVRS